MGVSDRLQESDCHKLLILHHRPPFDAILNLRYTVGYFHGPQISDKDLEQDLERISTRVRTMIAAHIEETIQCAG